MKKAKFAVTYGNTNDFAEPLQVLFVSTATQVREMAKTFIKVIPDELEPYLDDIAGWDGRSEFHISHQDDDTFLFQVTPVSLTEDLTSFNQFVTDNLVEDDGRPGDVEEDEDDSE